MEKKQRNVGLDLLKIWMCLEVILNHWWEAWYGEGWMIPFMYFFTLAVPCFAIISAYFMGPMFLEGDKAKLLKRLWRLILPQLAWTVIYAVIYGFIDGKFNVEGFFFQLFFGHSYNSVLWFQIDLIIITAVFGLIYLLVPKKWMAHVAIGVLGVAAVILEYTGVNEALFANFRYETKYPMGRMVEMIPFVVIGIYLYSFKVYKLLESKIWIRIAGILVSAVLAYASFIFIPGIGGYGYAGFFHILTALFGVSLFYLIPLHKVPFVSTGISFVAKYTMGIYFMNNLIATLLVDFVYPNIKLEEKTFYFCLVVFAVSLLVSFLISLIPVKWVKKIVE